MIVSPVRTDRISAGQLGLQELITRSLTSVPENSVLAITSKIVSLCEGAVVDRSAISHDGLMQRESQLYLPPEYSVYGHHFTITNNTLIPAAGIDESNGEGYYILWPRDSQATANRIRRWLQDTYGLTDVGVIITDSTCRPMRRGTSGIALAYSGFVPLRNYVGTPDLFGRPFGITQADIAGGLAAAAVVAMGEGAEQTPLCLLSDVSIDFCDRDPTPDELSETTIQLDDDLFAPFLTAVNWRDGGKSKSL